MPISSLNLTRGLISWCLLGVIHTINNHYQTVKQPNTHSSAILPSATILYCDAHDGYDLHMVLERRAWWHQHYKYVWPPALLDVSRFCTRYARHINSCTHEKLQKCASKGWIPFAQHHTEQSFFQWFGLWLFHHNAMMADPRATE